MIKHYAKTALRFLKRNRLFAAINVFGLSLALAVSFTILLFVINELSVDRCHQHRKRIYRVNTYLEEFKMTEAGTPYVLAPTLMEEYAQVEEAVSARYLRGIRLKHGEDFILQNGVLGTSSAIFDIFTLDWVEGPATPEPLRDRNAIVLNEEVAGILFPDMDALGKEVHALIDNEEQELVVSGVVKKLPANSTFRATCFVNGEWTLSSLNATFKIDNIDQRWDYNFWRTWILLSGDADPGFLEEQLPALGRKYISENPPFSYSFQQLPDIYLRSAGIANSGMAGDLKNIRLFSTVALLILCIAAINYMILSMAVSSGRAREIGIRKMAGAEVSRIRKQLLGESVALSILVLPISLLLMWALIPPAEKLFQTSLDLIRSNLLAYMLIFLSLAILIGAASGIYASSYLSRLKVLQIIQGKTTFGKRRRALRSLLITMQLIIFCAFVSGTLLIRSQHRFALQKDPGHLREHVLQIYLGRDFKGYEPYLDAVRNYSDVISAAGVSSGLPRLGFGAYMQDHFQDKEKKVQMEGVSVDYGAMETLGISVVQGRDFSREFGSDLGNAILINEKAVKDLGIVDPLGAKVGGRTVIGVVKDFNVHSIHSHIPPLSISLTDRYIRNILVRYRPGNLTGLLAALKEEWKKVEPDMPFRYDLMEDLFQAVYAEEKNLSTILALASLFALLIATFGLFGLTLFMARARTQEIGIRKVMGSSERNIVWLFLKSYLFLILIAGLAAIPVTWWFTKRWLEQFAYRVDIHWWLFLPAFILALVVVVPTVYLHARKASRINPVEAIRYE